MRYMITVKATKDSAAGDAIERFRQLAIGDGERKS